MKVKVPYGRDFIEVEVPEERLGGVLLPNEVPARDEEEVLREAVEHPHGGPTLREFLEEAKDILVIVNDGTRPTPTAKVLSFLEEKMAGVDFRLMVATGVHRAPTEEEMRFIFGQHYMGWKDRIFVHDCRDAGSMEHIGRSKAGTEMYVNRMGVEAGAILVIGSVEPHYFGGYTGGRKSFLPGIASYGTIEQNHKYAIRPEPRALRLAGNPVHEDMEDAIRTIEAKPIFSVQTVLDRHRGICAAAAGDIHRSFESAVEKANEVFCVGVPCKYDVVVSAAPYPMDVDLYQSQKAVDNARLALEDGGILILVSSCRTGVGERGFFDLMSSARTPGEVLEKIEGSYKLGYHKAAKLAEAALASEMWALTGLRDEEMKAVFMRPVRDLQKAIDEALLEKGEGAKALFLLEGSVTVPLVEKGDLQDGAR